MHALTIPAAASQTRMASMQAQLSVPMLTIFSATFRGLAQLCANNGVKFENYL